MSALQLQPGDARSTAAAPTEVHALRGVDLMRRSAANWSR